MAAPTAQANDPNGNGLRALTNNYTAQVETQLSQCASDLGVPVAGNLSVVTGDNSTAAFMPVAGVEDLTRSDLATWTTVGIFTAAGPADAEAPSGTFTVQVQAALGSTNGEFRILDSVGAVVQSGEMTITEDADATPPSQTPDQTLVGDIENLTDEYHYGCPWYYPYYYPYYFRYYPYYWYGCYWWHYQWWWGKLQFRYCWWPNRYCHRCCWW
ncbi:MAG: hypothetical protein SX243_04000 [Acidobacteriota bacterium]|nr:hypothetical protein [Acidobacteriota bacterium]